MISGTNLVLMVMMLWLLIVNLRKNGINLKAAILLYGFINTVYNIIRYGFYEQQHRKYTIFVVQIFGYTMNALLCYYYTQKATGLLDNRKDILCFLRMFLVIGTFVIVIGAIYLNVLMSIDQLEQFCYSKIFQGWQWIKLLMSVVFAAITKKIASKIKNQNQQSISSATPVTDTELERQQKTIRKVATANFFAIIT